MLLTRREEECLRLVAQGYLSDEIARRLGLSTHTINKYVEEAVRKLGGAGRGRRAVAREFVAAFPAAPEQLVPEPLGVESIQSLELEPVPADVEQVPQSSADAPGNLGGGRWSNLLNRLPLRQKGERSIRLTPIEILIWVPLLALLISLMIGAGLANLEALNRLRQQGTFRTWFPSSQTAHPGRR